MSLRCSKEMRRLFKGHKLRGKPRSMNQGVEVTTGPSARYEPTSSARNRISRLPCRWRRRRLHSGVRRRQSILPTSKGNLWRPHPRAYARRASAVSSPPQETDSSESVSCDRSRPSQDQQSRQARESPACRFGTFANARQPFRRDYAPGTTRQCINDRPLPCRSVAQVQRRLPPSPSSASTQATIPLYGI